MYSDGKLLDLLPICQIKLNRDLPYQIKFMDIIENLRNGSNTNPTMLCLVAHNTRKRKYSIIIKRN